ncbi:MAG: hypothetical protein DMF56_25635 [Acidobacteria bacterium]|nr:MAG: hypothetical protein DMF56_25635 [Acidobacteriota bacterium]
MDAHRRAKDRAVMERFLVEPALFPRRISGETWGTESVTIDLAGDRYRIDGLASWQVASLASRYGPRMNFVGAAALSGTATAGGSGRHITSGDAVATLQVFRAPRSDFREIDTRGWEYWLDLQWDDNALAIAGMRLMARVDLASMRGGIWTCVDDPDEFWGLVENVLRPILAAQLLDRGNGLLVHSAAADGFLFPSTSGGGKSTIARMALDAGLPVLSDDLNAIVRREDQWMILPLPFTGDLLERELSATPQRLRAIVAIEKSTDNALRNMPAAAAVSLLTRCSPYVNQDPQRTDALVSRAAEIAAAVPRAMLAFTMGGNVWPILNRA